VRHQQNPDAAYHSDGLPSQLTIDLAILGRDVVRVVENQRCGFEANAMFSKVRTVLALVPCELQSAALSQHYCIDSLALF
jgi:hypothetical protein